MEAEDAQLPTAADEAGASSSAQVRFRPYAFRRGVASYVNVLVLMSYHFRSQLSSHKMHLLTMILLSRRILCFARKPALYQRLSHQHPDPLLSS